MSMHGAHMNMVRRRRRGRRTGREGRRGGSRRRRMRWRRQMRPSLRRCCGTSMRAPLPWRLGSQWQLVRRMRSPRAKNPSQLSPPTHSPKHDPSQLHPTHWIRVMEIAIALSESLTLRLHRSMSPTGCV